MNRDSNYIAHTSDVVSLREHLQELLSEVDRRYEQRFQAQESATNAALRSAQLAVDKAEDNATKWRANANEWRDAMDNKDKLLATKNEVNVVRKDIEDLKTIRDIAIGKASQSSMLLAIILSIAGLLLGIIGMARTFIK